NNDYNAAFGTWAGWSYSRVADVTTPGFTNQHAAYNVPGGGSGDGSANYGVAFQAFDFVAPFPPIETPTVALPEGQRPVAERMTNTTYAALSMLNGDGFAKKFGGASGNDPDFFLLTITGRNGSGDETGTVEFYLADYRFTDNSLDSVVDRWTT